MFTGLKHAHLLFVILFLISMLIKTILIFKNQEKFIKYRQKTKIPEMIIATLFLVSGIMMLVELEGTPLEKTPFIIKFVLVIVGIPLGIIGSKKMSKVLVLLSFLSFFVAYGMAEMSKTKVVNTADVSGTESKEELGQKIYKANCVVCHGEDGKKGLADASDLSVSSLSATETEKVIVEGRGNMAPWKDVLSEDEIKAVADYVETLRK